ncbi:MAG TPA: class I SAM-dependent methyltransferase [Thermohalobaculum sp.]|nr:class I SAM-dependent methyltransferase [Thermohalobaculum sp.]
MAEAEFWAGPMGQQWARHAEALDRQLEPAGAAGLAALAPAPGERILDLGCGSGATTAALCAAVGPAGRVTGADISADQIAVARSRPGCAMADFVVGNAQTHPFEAGAYDALFSRFGCMFFADPPAAFANLHRPLKPGARVILLAWTELGRNPWAAVPAAVGSEVLGPADPPAPGVPGPFAWAVPEVFRPILEAGGFAGVKCEEVPLTLQIGESGPGTPVERATAMVMRIGPLARRLKDQPPKAAEAVASRLAPALEPFVRDGWVRMPGIIWVIRARA